MANKYGVEVFWSEEDGCYIARAAEAHAVSAFGDTRAEALAELEVALELALEAGAGSFPPARVLGPGGVFVDRAS